MRGQTTHPDTDVLAEFHAGLATGRRGARIAAHLAVCDRCSALRDELAGVSALLAAVPAQAMPDRVAQRLDSALAAEVARRTDSERARGDTPRDRGTAARPARNRGLRLMSLRVLAPAAAVVLAAAGYGLSQLPHGSGNLASPSSGVAGAAKPASRANAPALTPSNGPAARAEPERMSPASFPFLTSHTNFMPGTLKQQVEAALRVAESARATRAVPAAVIACVRHVAGSANPLMVESARYQGQAATIIVMRTSKGDTALVAGAGCSASHGQPLATTTVPQVPSGISGP
jgi:hypothetical protein